VPHLIGMDEAGYGPNLGPLVITTTAWEIPDNPQGCDLFGILASAVTRDASDGHRKLHIGDSKQVYSSSKGLASLERPVLALLQAAGVQTTTFHELWNSLAATRIPADQQQPWFADRDIVLPVATTNDSIRPLAEQFRDCLEQVAVGPVRIGCEVILTERFNRLVREAGSKGLVLSRSSLSLLRHYWNPNAVGSTLIVCDKHGGRNRYDPLIADLLDGQMILRVRESREVSIYRVGNSEIRFQMRAEAHFPVAVASMVSKYLREVSMLLFNQFWISHLPDLKPTKGYPTDARRFRSQIAKKQAEIGIADDVLWRHR